MADTDALGLAAAAEIIDESAYDSQGDAANQQVSQGVTPHLQHQGVGEKKKKRAGANLVKQGAGGQGAPAGPASRKSKGLSVKTSNPVKTNNFMD